MTDETTKTAQDTIAEIRARMGDEYGDVSNSQAYRLACRDLETLLKITENAIKYRGATWFMRCADCGEMYVASSGWRISDGADQVYWIRPKAKRTPKPCRHTGDTEMWNGSGWVGGCR